MVVTARGVPAHGVSQRGCHSVWCHARGCPRVSQCVVSPCAGVTARGVTARGGVTGAGVTACGCAGVTSARSVTAHECHNTVSQCAGVTAWGVTAWGVTAHGCARGCHKRTGVTARCLVHGVTVRGCPQHMVVQRVSQCVEGVTVRGCHSLGCLAWGCHSTWLSQRRVSQQVGCLARVVTALGCLARECHCTGCLTRDVTAQVSALGLSSSAAGGEPSPDPEINLASPCAGKEDAQPLGHLEAPFPTLQLHTWVPDICVYIGPSKARGRAAPSTHHVTQLPGGVHTDTTPRRPPMMGGGGALTPLGPPEPGSALVQPDPREVFSRSSSGVGDIAF